MCSPDIVAVRRLLIAGASRSGIGKLFHARSIVQRTRVATFLSHLMASGIPRADDRPGHCRLPEGLSACLVAGQWTVRQGTHH
jgi:hypothetical protein